MKLFTHLENNSGVFRDTEGREVSGVDEAVRTAARSAASVLEEELLRDQNEVKVRLLIEDEEGNSKATVNVIAQVERNLPDQCRT